MRVLRDKGKLHLVLRVRRLPLSPRGGALSPFLASVWVSWLGRVYLKAENLGDPVGITNRLVEIILRTLGMTIYCALFT